MQRACRDSFCTNTNTNSLTLCTPPTPPPPPPPPSCGGLCAGCKTLPLIIQQLCSEPRALPQLVLQKSLLGCPPPRPPASSPRAPSCLLLLQLHPRPSTPPQAACLCGGKVFWSVYDPPALLSSAPGLLHPPPLPPTTPTTTCPPPPSSPPLRRHESFLLAPLTHTPPLISLFSPPPTICFRPFHFAPQFVTPVRCSIFYDNKARLLIPVCHAASAPASAPASSPASQTFFSIDLYSRAERAPPGRCHLRSALHRGNCQPPCKH